MAFATPEAVPENFQVLQGHKRADIARDRVLETLRQHTKLPKRFIKIRG